MSFKNFLPVIIHLLIKTKYTGNITNEDERIGNNSKIL